MILKLQMFVFKTPDTSTCMLLQGIKPYSLGATDGGVDNLKW